MTPALIALRKAVEEAGSQAALAEKLGVTGPFVSMMLSGTKRIPEPILNYLGFERVIVEKEKA